MAGREKRRRAEALDGEEKRLQRRKEEAALLLRKIRGSFCFFPFPLPHACPNHLPPAVAGAYTCGPRRRRARALGCRGGGRGALPVYRAPSLPELLLLRHRRRCIPVLMVCILSPPHTLSSLPFTYFRQFQPAASDPHPCLCAGACVIAVPAATIPQWAQKCSPCSTRTATLPVSVRIRLAKQAESICAFSL
jgi:hypothetical protein